MSGAWFGLSVVAIILIMRWYAANERGDTNDGSRGILAFKAPDTSQDEHARAQSRNFQRSSR